MNRQTPRWEVVKFIAGAVIVCAAFVIMFPQIFGLALGLVRISIVIVVCGGLCLLTARATRAAIKMKNARKQPTINETKTP